VDFINLDIDFSSSQCYQFGFAQLISFWFLHWKCSF